MVRQLTAIEQASFLKKHQSNARLDWAIRATFMRSERHFTMIKAGEYLMNTKNLQHVKNYAAIA